MVINDSDIDEITKIMGRPEDYSVDEELFEDEPQYSPKTASKKLFRDADDKFLGGVCAGLAHYFGMDVIWMRLIWLVLFFFFGTGFLVYILLWILIPQAETTAEKLQMKGEPVNISNIERKIREEFQDVSSRVKNGVNEVSDTVRSSEFKNKAKTGIQEVIDTLGRIILAIFKIFGKFIGALLIFIASATLIGLIVAAFSWGSFEILGFEGDYMQYPPFFFDSIMPMWLLIVFGFLAIAIPFVVLFMLGLKILSSNVKSFSTTTKLSLLGVWIISILGLSFAGINFATQNAYDGVHNQTQELPIVAMDTLTINMIGNDSLSNEKELRRNHSYETVFDNDVEKLFSTRVNVDIKPTDKATAFVKIRKESDGKNRLTANKDAESIEYKFSLTEKNLLLNGYFLSDLKNKFKDQLIDVTVYLPVNSVVYLDASTQTYLNDVDNVQNIFDGDMPKHYFKMTENGLECLDCDPSIFGDDFKRDNENFKLNIDENGVEIKVNDGDKNAEVTIDENGVKVD